MGAGFLGNRWVLAGVLVLGLLSPVWAEKGESVAGADTQVVNSAKLPSDIPVRRENQASDSPEHHGFWLVWGVLGVGAVAWGVVLWARRRGHFGQQRPVAPWRAWLKPHDSKSPALLSSTRLTPRHTVHVVAWRGTEYLVGCSEQGVAVLGQATAEPRKAPS